MVLVKWIYTMFNYVQNVERSYKLMISDRYVNICVQSKSWLKIYQNELIYPQKTVFFLSLSLSLSFHKIHAYFGQIPFRK